MSQTYYCEKCHRTMAADNFYTSNNLEKYPNEGKLTQCKKCVTMHIDNWNPETYLWILEELDVPYSIKAWDDLLNKYGADPSKLKTTSILGRYLSKMKLSQYKDFRWKDTEFVQKQEAYRVEQTMKRQGYSAAEIAKVLADSPSKAPPGPPKVLETVEEIDDSLTADLTNEDKQYLCLKWGKSYKPDEWVRLEELYQQMLASYDIDAAGDLNTLKLACKSSLKANQMLDLGDIEGAQKASKMYNDYMKAGKWTAAQNKVNEENDNIDSISELTLLCESEGFIPKYYSDGPQDKVDRLIQDLKRYTTELVANEAGIQTLIERAAVQLQEEEQRIKAAADKSKADTEEEMFEYDKPVFTNEEFEEYASFQEEEEKAAEKEAEEG